MARVKRNLKAKKSIKSIAFSDYWSRENYLIFGVGVLLLILGFIFMSFGTWDSSISLTISPLLLLFAYLIIFPLSIFYKKNRKVSENTNDSSQS